MYYTIVPFWYTTSQQPLHPRLENPGSATEHPFLLQTDASDYAIGAVLSQVDDHGQQRVVHYLSRQLTDAEKKWDVREKELLAVVWACEGLRPYLVGQSFIVETDHANLQWLMAGKRQTGRLARWVLRLQEFTFEVKHKPGKANTNADALSRLPVHNGDSISEQAVYTMTCVSLPTLEELRSSQQQDPIYGSVIKYLQSPSIDQAPPEVESVLREAGEYQVDGTTGLLVYQFTHNGRDTRVPVLPPSSRLSVLTALHDLPTAGHLGRKKTFHRVRSQFYWKGMYTDVTDFVRSCEHCQRRKTVQPRSAGALQLFSATRPFQVVGVDLLGPFPRIVSGNIYAVVMVDRFTRWPEIVAIPDGTAEAVADTVVDKLIMRHGCPDQLLSDRGTQFTSRLFRRMSKRLGIKRLFTTAYHPQCNGQVERFNRFIAAALTAYVKDHQEDWDQHLEAIAFAYRTSVVDAVGDTPFHLVHGRDARLPTAVLQEEAYGDGDEHEYGLQLTKRLREAHNAARIQQTRADEERKQSYDSTHRDVDYADGELVWVYSPATKPGLASKLQYKWSGPYRVIEKTSPVNYFLKHVKSGRKTNVHVQRLSRYHRSDIRELESENEGGEEADDNDDDDFPDDDNAASHNLGDGQGDGEGHGQGRPRHPPPWQEDYVIY